jgi:hypothetical protein
MTAEAHQVLVDIQSRLAVLAWLAALVDDGAVLTFSIIPPPLPRYAIPPYLRTKDLRGTPYLSAYLVIPAPYPGKSSGASGVSGAREDCRLGAVLG